MGFVGLHHTTIHPLERIIMRYIAVCIAIALGFSTVSAKEVTTAKKTGKRAPEVTLTGYLVDLHCAKKLMEKSDVAIPAKQHERSCALMPECAASGYGVFVIVNKSATHASDVDLFKLDAAGNAKAKALLEKSTKKDDMLVTMHGKGTIAVEDITEMK
jgi:hypothetical protein